MRPIDADALLLKAKPYEDIKGDGERVMAVTDDEIMTAPTIDAVPVVRCKDCQWKEQEQPGMVYCPATVGGWVDEDWFCKGGERSEE